MIKFLENHQIDMSFLEIEDVLDVSLLQSFQDNFAVGMNCASVTVDRKGNPITKPSSYTRFCIDFIHKTPMGKHPVP